MQAIQLKEPQHFQQIDIAEPSAPGPGEALVRVHRVGICGTDYSGYLGKMPFYSYPRIPGHELGVEVIAVGEGVTHVRPGDHCSVEPYINCQECFACRRGRGNCCEKLQVLGVHTDGGLRPRLVLPARKLHASIRLALEQLALVETLAIGCHCVDRAAPQPGEQVLVIGAGPIGLSVIEFLKLAAARITVLDRVESRLEFCRNRMGVDETILSLPDTGGSEVREALRADTGGCFYPIVIDATGNPGSMSAALNYVAHTGSLVYVGITTEEVTFPHPWLHAREMTIKGSRNALPGDFRRIIALIEAGRIDTRPWITHRTPFAELIAEFPNYLRPETGVIKAVVELGPPQ